MLKIVLIYFIIFFGELPVIFPTEIRTWSKFNENTFFNNISGYTFQFGDSLIIYAITTTFDSTVIKPRLLCYYDGKFSEISNSKILIGQDKVSGSIPNFIKDNKSNFWFCLTNGGLFKLTPDGNITSYDSLLRANDIATVNSLSFDNDYNLWIHSNANLYKLNGDSLELKVPVTLSEYLIPHYLGSGNLYKLGNRIYYLTMKNTLAYYDTKNDKVDSVNYYPDNSGKPARIINFQFINNSLYFTYYADSVLHFIQYDEKEFTNIDYYLDAINYGKPLNSNVNMAFDSDMNLFIRTTRSNDDKRDTIFIVDTKLNVQKVGFKHLINYDFGFFNVNKLSNGDRYISIEIEGFFILSNLTSVESPTNLLFMNKLYPNPAQNKINIEFDVEPVNLSSTKVKIYDYLGRSAAELNPEVIYDSSTGRGTMTCDISKLRSGYYITVLTNGKYSKSMPLFVE
jgi:hypothetical protein